MPDGDMRRPPLLWEQRLAKRVNSLGPGVVTSSGANVVEDFGASTGYNEPDDTITTLGTPSTPTVTGTLKGVAVGWDGNDTDGDPYNAENQWVEVHVGGTAGFTPGTATKRGVLYESGSWVVTPLTAGSTYYAQLVGYDSEGNASEASAEASGTPGLVIASDIGTGAVGTAAVSFSARDVGGITQTVSSTQPASAILNDTWINTTDGSYNVYNGTSWVTQSWGSASISANSITTLQLAAGAVIAENIAGSAVTAAKINAGAVTSDKIFAGAVTTDKLTAGTITGFDIFSSSGSNKIALTSGDEIAFYSGGVKRFDVSTGYNTDLGAYVAAFSGGIDIGSGGLYVTGAAVDMPGVYNNNTTGIDSVGINPSYRLRRISSSQNIKYDMATLSGAMSTTVDADRQLGVATVTPSDVLNLAVTEFSVIDADEPTERRVLGFIADDVAEKFPIAATHDADGVPSGVLDTAIVASLVAVVKDLTARIEALEG